MKTKNKRTFERGVIAKTASQFKLTPQVVSYRIYHSLDTEIIDYAIKINAEIKNKKLKARKKLETIIEQD